MYWCNQASSLSQGQEEDVLRLAESLTNAKQYHRAAHLLKTSNLQTKSWKGCFLVVNSLFLAKNTVRLQWKWETFKMFAVWLPLPFECFHSYFSVPVLGWYHSWSLSIEPELSWLV